MKPIKFITTFSKNGYEVYGKTWIKTFLKNVKDENITANIYVDFYIKPENKINFIDYNATIPQHKFWLKNFENSFKGGLYNKKMGLRFSYKSFVMMHALENNKDCFVVWLDGDCIFKNYDNFNCVVELLNGNFIAVQREHQGNGDNDHCDTGIVILFTQHLDPITFLILFKNNYKIENIINMGSPYDGFIIYKSLNGLKYTDLNFGYGRHGIQSDPNETFLHPEINKRFLHNIGVTGKTNYIEWKNYSKKDEFFKLIQGKVQKSPEEIQKIRKTLLNKRIKK